MKRFTPLIYLIFILSVSNGQPWTDYLNSPINWTLGITNGYDNNVLRLSNIEKQNAALNQSMMGGTETFDSHYSRISMNGFKKIQLNDRKKQLNISMNGQYSYYSQNNHRRYWSGDFDMDYRWGLYRKLKYSLRHLDSYYIRHYIDRDVSTDQTASCNFTNREQELLFSYPLKLRLWATGFVSYTQRYFDRPFTEFDLDIFNTAIKISKAFKKVGTAAIQLEYGVADNITFGQTAKASALDRSFTHFEWYIPLTYHRGFGVFDEAGISFRRDFRRYKGEELNDPLHSGRSHVDKQWDIWGEKELGENLKINGTIRYRKRTTQSQYDWVSDLKSFDQIQAWLTLEWDMIYDRY